MTPVEMRLEALKLAVGQRGNPNVLQEAQKFFEFIKGPEEPAAEKKGKAK